MGKFTDYRKLEIYHSAHAFVLHIYSLIESFPKYEEDNLKSQLRRASTSLPINIAEGTGARSFRVFLNALTYSYGSAKECEAALYIARDLHYISTADFDKTFAMLDSFIRRLYRFMEIIERRCTDNGERKTSFYAQQKYVAEADAKKRGIVLTPTELRFLKK